MRGFGEPDFDRDIEEVQCRVCDKWYYWNGDFCSYECEIEAAVRSVNENGEDD